MGGIPSCGDENREFGCEKNGLLWYPRCRPGFHAVGCCVCSPDCPEGFRDDGAFCAKPTYGRGGGEIPDCSPGQEKDTGLCYNKCREGYYGVGPLCWKSCPPGWKDTGAGCQKDSYTNGAGYVLNNCGDKEMDAGLCYNKCPEGYKGVGPLCWKTCPSGWKDTGAQCQKDSYTNGAGYVLNYCGSKEMDAGLCYNKCPEGYNGVGPLCWKTCPPGWKDTGAQCQKDSYTNGAGFPLNHCGDKEMDAGLCYNKCPGGYKGVGPVCWASCPPGWKDTGVACEKDIYANGTGKNPSMCGARQELVGNKCLDNCPPGFIRRGTECVSKCPEGFVDSEDVCMKRDNVIPKQVCNPNQLLLNGNCYANCPTGYQPDETGLNCIAICPENWKLVDGKCVKNIIDNTASKVNPTLCPTGYVVRDGKCYPQCPPEFPYGKNQYCYKFDFDKYAQKIPGLKMTTV